MPRVWAIDPGNIESAYCLVETGSCRAIAFEKMQNPELLFWMRQELPGSGAEAVAIERVASYGMPVGREVFETCEWIGKFALAAEEAGMPVEYIYRRDEKLAICHSPNANDTTIRKALIDRFADHDLRTGKGTKKDPDWFYGFKADCWMAYAVAVTYIDRQGGKA